MNVSIQIYGMIILVLLYIFYNSHKTLGLYTERVFIRAMYVSMINLALDILSVVAIYYMDQLPLMLVKAVCKLYVVSLIWEGLLALAYVLTDLYSEKIHRKKTWAFLIIAFVQSLIVLVLPLHIHFDSSSTYTYGPSVMCVYVFAVTYVLSTLLLSIFNKKLNKRRSFAMLLWMCIWIGAAGLQFLFNELLLVGFATAIGILILFVIMENPEAHLDKKLGCFNSYALGEYLNRQYDQKFSFSMLMIAFSEAVDEKLGAKADEISIEIVQLISKSKKNFVFRNVDSNIAVINNNHEELIEISQRVKELLDKRSVSLKELCFVVVPKCEKFQSREELMGFIGFMSDRNNDGEIAVADDVVIKKYSEKEIIRQEISDALRDDRIEVYLQPIYSNTENAFTSAEALARLRRADGSMLSPAVFIPVAEQSGLIVELGERVFEKVCEFLKSSSAISLGLHYVEINLSVVQCEMSDLSDRLIAITEKFDVSPLNINLEITETASVTARNTLLNNMNRLIAYGFSFSLDDFGKGESNLMYVVEMPVSLIKLDYDMSKAYFKTDRAKHVVHAVVNMAHEMELKVVAEGIENKDEIDEMEKISIDYIQGYYYSRPLPMDEFIEFIKKK